jgi:hypothetical protein
LRGINIPTICEPYDRKKHAAILREAVEPFVLCFPNTPEENLLNHSFSEEELKRFPSFLL